MDQTQSFRLIGSTQIVTIPVLHVGGEDVVSWKSIKQVFPGVKCVKNGDVEVLPYIKYLPDTVLDVDLSSVTESVRVDYSPRMELTVGLTEAPGDPPSDPSSQDKAVEDLRVTSALVEIPIGDIAARSPFTDISVISPSSPSLVKTSPKTTLSFQQVAKLVSRLANESYGRVHHEELSAIMDYILKSHGEIRHWRLAFDAKQDEMTQLQKTSDAKQEKMNQLQEQLLEHQMEMLVKQEEMEQLTIAHQEEMKQMHQRVTDLLSVLQSRVQAVLTQTYELHEYPIPRLFIVLPQYPSGWNILEPFTEKYRLYFLCECGEHTKAAGSNSKISHKIHLAKHEGYEIARPTDFFKQYGPYVLTMLKMLKFGVSVASVAVPAVAHLINADALDHAAKGLQHLKDCIEPGMDQMISKIEKDSVDETEPVENFTNRVENKDALKGVDLRKLETFLKGKDENKVLGNLYRTVTDQGHVKWVCMDHYRENYNITAAEAFRRTVGAVGGSFDENTGTAKVKLQSRVLSEQFYSGLQKARSVHELDISLDFEGTRSDLEALADALKTSNVSILHLHLQQFRPSLGSKLRSTSVRYDVLCRIIEHPTLKMIHIVLPSDFVDLSIFPSKPPSHLHKLSLDMDARKIGAKNLGLLFETLKTNKNLTTLNLAYISIGSDGAKALAEALKTNSTLATLNLYNSSVRDDGAKALAEALKTNSTLDFLNLEKNLFREDGARALAEALKTNKTLTILNLGYISVGDDGAKALAEALKINSTLAILNLYNSS
ncbi:hypothetical protein BGZ72_010785, partial [Mortierella alpina]